MNDDEEPIRNWTGEVLAANFDAVVLTFRYMGQPRQAMAVAEVCYDEKGHEVRNLHTCTCYAPGSRVFFDAILSSRSDLPYIWKVAAAWTTSKPRYQDLYSVYEHQFEIVELYSGCYINSCLLNGDNDIPDKDLELEIEALEYFVGQLKEALCDGIVYHIDTTDIEELLDEAEDHVVDYIRDCHNQVIDFFLFHPTVFRVQKNQSILPCSYKKLEIYHENILPDILDDAYEDWEDDDSSSYDET